MTLVLLQSFEDASKSLAEKLAVCKELIKDIKSTIDIKDEEISQLRTDNKRMVAEIAVLRSGRNLLVLQQRVVDDAKDYCRVGSVGLCREHDWKIAKFCPK